MSVEKTCSFFLNDKTFQIPRRYELINNISSTIVKQLFEQDEYYVHSKVKEETFQNFINFLLNRELPTYHADDILEYVDLFQEFEIKQDLLQTENERDLYKKAVIQDLISSNQNKERKLASEKYVAEHLDEFLEKYPTEMKRININSLCNIFFHKYRNLASHDLAYRFITENNDNNDESIFILLDSIDGKKLLHESYKDSIAKQNEHFGFIPQNCISYINEHLKELENMKMIIQKHQEEFEEQKQQLIEMHKKEMEEIKKEIISIKEKQQKSLEKYKNEIDDLNEKLRQSNPFFSFKNAIICQDMKMQGICEKLRNENITFFVSQSSNDIYNILNPDTRDEFQFVVRKDQTFLQIDLGQSIEINGIEFHTEGLSNPLKSFSIELDNKVEVNEFDDKDHSKGVRKFIFNKTKCKTIKIVPDNKEFANNDKSEAYPHIKSIELLSPDPKYSEGYFKTLLKENESHDPHKIGVLLSAYRYDFNNFHLHGIKKKNTSSLNKPNQWFQIEFNEGMAIITGFRYRSPVEHKLQHYKIVATDDVKKDISLWVTLYENDEDKTDTEVSHQFSWIRWPMKAVRIIQTQKNKNNELKFFYFDIFGFYFQ
ncbi:hypothetical protein M9Y10_032010 [Tritrichomonas musculus]|uniref:F5/8 type C domain-containing protein n=1 Tax=Tritrichomonas musculus TaxID=1915356 RepID=A0ABR2H0D6_9EUKA